MASFSVILRWLFVPEYALLWLQKPALSNQKISSYNLLNIKFKGLLIKVVKSLHLKLFVLDFARTDTAVKCHIERNQDGSIGIKKSTSDNFIIKKTALFGLLFFSYEAGLACKCPDLEPISTNFCENYDVIFYGKVDSISQVEDNRKNTVHFKIYNLYKGKLPSKANIYYDATSPCMMSFSPEEEWLIYAYYEKYNLLTVNICQHS